MYMGVQCTICKVYAHLQFCARFGGEAGQSGDGDKEGKEETKDEPNFGLSGKLTAETNTYKV